MTHLREHWEGVRLSGEYTLEQWLGGDESAAFFQTSLSPEGPRAVVKLLPEASVDSAATLDLWRRIHQLRHPNLIELLDCGRAGHRGEIVIYAVYEHPDDTLTDALGKSPLNREESREVLDATLAALRYLHAQGLVLGVLDPDHIVAVGDRIKLSTAALRDADTSSAYREDVRLLGELWRQVLMPASAQSAEIAAHAADPDSQTRWTLAEIGAALGDAPPQPAVAPAAPPSAVAAPVAAPVVSPAPSPERPTVRNATSAPPQSHRSASERAPAYRVPRWVFAGIAGVVLLVLGFNRPRHSAAITKPPVAAAAVSLPAETPVPVPAPAPKAAVPSVPKPAPAAGKEIWRVIAFTYRSHAAAAKKVEQINQNHAGLNATVFTPQDKQGYYLVSLGGRMTHEEAARLRRSARGKGLPRDLYVQNYAE